MIPQRLIPRRPVRRAPRRRPCRATRKLVYESLERRELLSATYHETSELFLDAFGKRDYIKETFVAPDQAGSSMTITGTA